MFSQPMGRGHAQFEFSQNEMREILIDINRANLKMSPSMVEFRAMLRAMLAMSEPRPETPT